MNWLNIDAFLAANEQSHGSNSQNSQQLSQRKPQPRWGQACVAAHNKFYIIGGYEGQYLGDVWSYDFNTLSYNDLKLEGENIQQLSRSNHTAVFYQKHNAIYVFGGGQAQKQRFNDTLKLDIDEITRRPTAKELKISKVIYKQDSPIPVARTYHASCLMRNYMIIIGGEATSDLKDFWALDLDDMQWYKPEIQGFDNYTPKRFHTATSIDENRLITFGGCHSEYIHMNEMHIFDLSQFYLDPSQHTPSITCIKVLVNEGVPSTRWGHSASMYNGKLYILGGRNEQDIIDLHEFDPNSMKWKQMEITAQLPKARRRHSCLFVSGSLVMFGGFDGNFFNDLNVLDFTKPNKQVIQIQLSTIDQDYGSLVNNQENSDICFILNNSTQTKIYAHKALILFRAIEKEMQIDLTEDATFYQLVQDQRVPDFIVTVYYSKKGDVITLPDVHCKNSFIKFLEFLYCDKFTENMTTTQVRAVSEITKALNLNNITSILKKKVDGAKLRIHQQIVQELQAKQPSENLSLNRQQHKQLKQKVEQLESQLKLDFTQFDDYQIQSPEDKFDRQHQRAASLMNQCKNLDEFYDIVFMVEETLIKANSLVLMVRCPYFKSMLSTKYSFKEVGMRNSGQIKVQGVPKSYFTNIIQYIYSDHFYIQRQEAEFFARLLIYADYFMLPRLVDICSSYLKPFINAKSVLKILLIAHAHNAQQLENYCITFITQNEQEIMESRQWRSVKRQAQESLLQYILKKIREEKEESFIQICLWQYIHKVQQNSNQSNIKKQLSDNSSKSRQKSNNSGSRGESNHSQGQMSQNTYNKPSSQCSKDEEIDLDEIFNTANYIYLEEHNKYETYNLETKSSNHNKTKSFVSPLPNFTEEEKENKSYLSADEFNDLEDKENMSIFNNLHKYTTGVQPINSIPISNNKNKFVYNKKALYQKKRDIKRVPLQSLENESSVQGSTQDSKENMQIQPFKRGPEFEQECSFQNQERASSSQLQSNFTQQQTQQNCNIFQAR